LHSACISSTLQLPLMYRVFHGHVLSLFLDIHLGVAFLSHTVALCVTLWHYEEACQHFTILSAVCASHLLHIVYLHLCLCLTISMAVQWHNFILVL
jgi:hypothetical protein